MTAKPRRPAMGSSAVTARRLCLLAAPLIVLLAGPVAANPVADGSAGLDAMKAHDYDTAIKLFTRALASKSLVGDDRELALYQRGLAHLNKHEYPLAVADLRQAVKLKPDDAEAQDALQLAVAHRSPSLVAPTPPPEPEPANALAAAQAGSRALDRGQFERAVQLFTKAIQGDLSQQDLELAYFSRAKANFKLHAEGPALSDLSQALKLNPGDTEAQAAVAQVASGHPRPVGAGPGLDLAACTVNYTSSGNPLGTRTYTTYANYPKLTSLDAYVAAFNYAVAASWNVSKVDYDGGAFLAARDAPGRPGAIAVTVVVEVNPTGGTRTTVKMQAPPLVIATDLKETMCDLLASLPR